jgi:hypothetical protein
MLKWTRAYAIAVLLAACGCASVAPPQIFHPGPARYQQDQAQLYDPYPEPEGGGDMSGARPRQYLNPPPESTRAQNVISYERRFGQPPPPGRYGPIRGAEYVPVQPAVPVQTIVPAPGTVGAPVPSLPVDAGAAPAAPTTVGPTSWPE